MVRARAAGLKTQTRRIITKANSNIDGHGSRVPYARDGRMWEDFDFTSARIDKGPSPAGNPGPYLKVPLNKSETVHRLYPRIQPGDHIWWKETWKIVGWDEDGGQLTLRYPATNAESITVEIPEEKDFDGEKFNTYWMQSCDDLTKAGIEPGEDGIYLMGEDVDEKSIPTRNRSSMLMPRWAARFVDTVIAVRPERLQDISTEDCYAEGIVDTGNGCGYVDLPNGTRSHALAKVCYMQLINALHGHGTWNSNPWVWVYTMSPAKAGAPHQNNAAI